jgi:hypothetical protein
MLVPNPLKPKRREREERQVGWVVSDITFNRGGGGESHEGPQAVPARPSGKSELDRR